MCAAPFWAICFLEIPILGKKKGEAEEMLKVCLREKKSEKM